MKILYVHQHFATPVDSIGTRSYEFARRLIDAGHEVTMLCGDTAKSGDVDSSSARVVNYEVDGIKVVKIREPYANAMGVFQRIKSFIKFGVTASSIARSTPADIVFATSTPLTAGIPGVLASKKQNIPFVFEVRDLWPELPIGMGVIKNPVIIFMLRKLEHYLYDSATSIIALAPGIREGIESYTGSDKKVETIPNSSDVGLFIPSSEPLNRPDIAPDDILKVVYCGHHGKANGLDAAIDAAKQLKDSDQHGIKFVMIGTGSEKNRLIQRSKDEGVELYFNWIDSIPKSELSQLLPRMDVGLMPLMNVRAFQYGTSPNKFFDYLAAGLPVLNNYPGWVSDLITEHNCGLSVAPDKPADLAKQLLWLRDNRESLQSMGIASRHLAESQFSRDGLGKLFIAHLESAYQQHNQ